MDDYMYLLFELCGTGPGCSPEKKTSHLEEPVAAPRPRRPSRRPPARRTLAALAAH